MNEIKTLSYMVQKYHLFQDTYLFNKRSEKQFYLTIKPNHRSINYCIEQNHKSKDRLEMHQIFGQFYYSNDKSIKENYNDFIEKIEEEIEAEKKARELALKLLKEL